MSSIFYRTDINTKNYDATLIGWAKLAQQKGVQKDVILGAEGLKYCNSKEARSILTSPPYNWKIAGDELSCEDEKE